MHPVAHYFLALCELRKSLEGILVGDLILNYLRAQQEQAIALLKPAAPPPIGRALKAQCHLLFKRCAHSQTRYRCPLLARAKAVALAKANTAMAGPVSRLVFE